MKLLNFWKPGIWLAIICYLSLIPGNELPPVFLFNIPHFDKVVHLGFYFIFCLLLINPFSKVVPRPYLFSFLGAVFISGLIEILQEKLIITRHGDFFDFIANMAGTICALLFYRFFISGKNKERYF